VRSEALFHRVDRDGSGAVEKEEIMAVHQGGDWEAMFVKLDVNGDGAVTLEEWLGLFVRVEEELGEEKAVLFLEYLEGGVKEAAAGAAGVDGVDGEMSAQVEELQKSLEDAATANVQWSAQVEELQKSLEGAEAANVQWSEYAGSLGEAKVGLEEQVAALQRQLEEAAAAGGTAAAMVDDVLTGNACGTTVNDLREMESSHSQMSSSLARLHAELAPLCKRFNALTAENEAYQNRIKLLEDVANVQTKRLVRLEKDLEVMSSNENVLTTNIFGIASNQPMSPAVIPSSPLTIRQQALATRLQSQAQRLSDIQKLTECLQRSSVA